MRKLGATLLAAPVAMLARVGSLDPRGATTRLLAVAAACAVVASFVAGTHPASSAAAPETPPSPVSADLFSAIGTAHAPTAPFTVAFDGPMNRATVAGALTIEPAAPYTLHWDPSGRVLTINPVGHWRPATLYSLVIGPTATSEDGGALAAPVRTAVLTARGGSAAMAATEPVADRVRLDTAFSIRLDRDASVSAVRAALRSDPPIAGDVVAGTAKGTWVFRPYGPLAPDTEYRVWLDDLEDADGVPFGALPAMTATTIQAPEVSQLRPRDGATKVKRSTSLSVRFSQPMDEAATAEAFAATADGKAVAGEVRWSDDGTALEFHPATALPYGARVVLTVNLAARSRDGAPIARAARSVFRVQARPGATLIPRGGGGGAVSGSWLAVERYYLKLMNCTRTGGWVTSGGRCSSPGGRDVAPLALSSAISSKVSRPYAKLLATRNLCSHFIGGNPGDRLRRAGYGSYRWAENLGCRGGNAYSAVLGSHLFFQSEKPWNGGHYRNLMNAAFDRVGIGVWVSGGRVRLVIDFYHR